MSKAVINNADLLRILSKADPALRQSIIKKANCTLIRGICEVAENTLQGNVPLKPNQKSKLCRHKKILRKLVKKGEKWQKKKKILMQKGGAILPLILGPLLGTLLSSLI